LGFVEETREYLVGRLRKGTTISGKEVADVIRSIKNYLPACVKKVILLGDGGYVYRDFVTNHSGKSHQAIDEYDKRADCENQIGEVKREGLSAIPTHQFMNNYAYFQIVLLSYNVWRSFKMIAEYSEKLKKAEEKPAATILSGIQDNTLRIARLKLLLIAAKLVTTGNTTKVKYSEHDSRAAGLFSFMEHLDRVRAQARPWLNGSLWQCRHMAGLRLQRAENTS